MNKILVISAALPPLKSGESEHTIYLCRHLAKQGLCVHLLTTPGHEMKPEPGVSIHTDIRDWSWSDLPRLESFVRQCAPDGILLLYTDWIYHWHPMITFAPSICKRACSRVKFVTQFEYVHEQFGRLKSLPVRALRQGAKLRFGLRNVDRDLGTLLRDSDGIIVLAEEYQSKLETHSAAVAQKTIVIPPPPLLRVVPNADGTGRQRGRTLMGITADEFLVAFYGFIKAEKGIDTLLTAFASLSRSHPQARLALIGGIMPGPETDELQQMPARLGIAEKVFWSGDYASDSETASLCLHAADLCALPFDDGVALNRSSLAAVVSHEIPVVSTRGPRLETPFQDKENIWLCPPKNPEALAAALRSVIDDAVIYGHLKEGARHLAKEWFSWNMAVERTLRLFDFQK